MVGAGPAGLSAALVLARRGVEVHVLEGESRTGGLSATLAHEDFRFDIGGHRFFTKNAAIEQFFLAALKGRVLKVNRQSHIYFGGKFLAYPLSVVNALKGMGTTRSVAAAGSYLYHRLHDMVAPTEKETFEAHMVANFGRQLYESFFEGYTEKVWGLPCDQISADWASQRIRGMSLLVALKNALRLQRRSVATLVSQFHYPRDGFGAFCDGLAVDLEAAGGSVILEAPVAGLEASPTRLDAVTCADGSQHEGDLFLLTNPLTDVVKWLDRAPGHDQSSPVGLRWRGLVTVFLALDVPQMSSDHWIYLPDKEIPFGRLHEPKNWSRDLAPARKTGVVAEYFADPGDPIWTRPDRELLTSTATVLEELGFVPKGCLDGGRVDRWKFAYPTYTLDYRQRTEPIYARLRQLGNTSLAGRTGMFRYHNADHAIETGFEAADFLLGGAGDPFRINVAGDYHEGE